MTYVFSGVGDPVDMPALNLAPGTSVPPTPVPSQLPPADWQSYVLAYSPYTVDLPGAPSTTTNVIENPNLGRIDTTIARLQAVDGARFSVIEGSLPATYIQATGKTSVLQEAVSIEAKNLGATIVGTRALETGGTPGIDAVLATSGAVYRIRFYVFDTSTLELGAAGSIANVANADVDRFLSSLALRT